MPTDMERREVARRLRGQAKKLGPNMDAHEFAHYTADVIDVNKCMTWHEMTLLLADLIEPSDMSHGCRDGVACDREALLALTRWLDARATDLLKTNSIDRSRRRMLVRKERAMDLMIVCGLIREALEVAS